MPLSPAPSPRRPLSHPQDLTAAVNAAVAGAAAAPPAGLHAPLAPGQTPLLWLEGLGLAAHKFKPAKHRKFVERLAPASAAQAEAWLRLTHDARLPAEGSSPALDAARKALAAQPFGARDAAAPALALDLHAFHSSVVPTAAKKGAAKQA